MCDSAQVVSGHPYLQASVLLLTPPVVCLVLMLLLVVLLHWQALLQAGQAVCDQHISIAGSLLSVCNG
jgi:hypothetical protein